MSELSGNPEQLIAVFQKFNSRFTVLENDCWQWNAATSKDGYGFMRVGAKILGAHRMAYEIHKGEIPNGLHIDHLCSNRKCVNPEHLEAVTPGENARRSSKTLRRCEHGSGYTRCKEGCGAKAQKEKRMRSKEAGNV